MKCEEFRQMLDEYIDGALNGEERAEMERHAGGCAACKEEMDTAIQLSALLAGLDDDVSVPLEAQAAWRKAVRTEAKNTGRRLNGWMRGLGTVAAALVVLVTGTYGMRMNQAAVTAPQPTIVAAGMIDGSRESDMDARGYSRLGTDLQTGGTLLQSDGEVTSGRGVTSGTEEKAAAPVVLRSAERSVRSDSYDSDFLWLEDLVSEYDAYFEERSETAATEDGSSGRVASAVVRVPSDRLDDFLTELDQLGRTVLSSEINEDVTGRYTDTQSRLNALAMQKVKLDEMLESAENLEELIAIDDKLTEVISAMETLEGDLRRWESRQNYSRVTLTLTEVLETEPEVPASLGERMKRSFHESVVWLKQFGQDALVAAASMAPKMVIWIPAAVLVVVLVCAIRAGRRRR